MSVVRGSKIRPEPYRSPALVEGGGFQTDGLKGACGSIRVRCYPPCRHASAFLFLRVVCPGPCPCGGLFLRLVGWSGGTAS